MPVIDLISQASHAGFNLHIFTDLTPLHRIDRLVWVCLRVRAKVRTSFLMSGSCEGLGMDYVNESALKGRS